MSILNADGFVELAQKALENAPSYLNIFDESHWVIYNSLYMWGYVSLFLAYAVKWMRDASVAGDQTTKGQYLVGVSFAGLLLLPVSIEEDRRNLHGISKDDPVHEAAIYHYGKIMVLNYLHGIGGAYKSLNETLEHQRDRTLTSNGLVRLYQESKIQHINTLVGTEDVLRPYAEYKKFCSSKISDAIQLNGAKNGISRHSSQTALFALGISDKSWFGYEATLEKMIDTVGKDDRTLSGELVIDALKETYSLPELIGTGAYYLYNPAWVKAQMLNETRDWTYNTDGVPKYIPDSGFSDGITESLDINIFTDYEKTEMIQDFNAGYVEYRNYISRRINENYIDEEMNLELTSPGGPLSIASNESPLRLIPVDCASFAMIINMLFNGLGHAVGSAALFNKSDSMVNANSSKADYFVTRIGATGLALESILKSYKVDEGLGHNSWWDSLVSGVATISEAKDKIVEGYKMDVTAPILYAGCLMLIGFLLSVSLILITLSSWLPNGFTTVFNIVKLILFLMLVLTLAQFGIQYIDNQINQSVAAWMIANFGANPNAADGFQFTTDFTDSDVRALGSQSLSAVVLAANESSRVYIIASVIISYGIIFGFKNLLMPGNFKSSSLAKNTGEAPQKITDKASDITKGASDFIPNIPASSSGEGGTSTSSNAMPALPSQPTPQLPNLSGGGHMLPGPKR